MLTVQVPLAGRQRGGRKLVLTPGGMVKRASTEADSTLAKMAQRERELMGERTRAALAAAKAQGTVLGGDRGWRPAAWA